MRFISKSKIIIVGIIAGLIVARVFYGHVVKSKFVSAVSRAQYAVLRSCNSEQRTNITESVRKIICDAIDGNMSLRVFDTKSVSYGTIFLLDGNMSPISQIWILEYPLFTFDRTQIELHCDIVGACGFSIKGYQCNDKLDATNKHTMETP